MWCEDEVEFEDLKGKTLIAVKVVNDEEIDFIIDTGEHYKMLHYQDCCESVTVEDIVGDLDDLIGTPILMAEEAINEDENPEDYVPNEWGQESFTWTFYKLATIKGYVTIRWYGESNGYYSESVSFVRM